MSWNRHRSGTGVLWSRIVPAVVLLVGAGAILLVPGWTHRLANPEAAAVLPGSFSSDSFFSSSRTASALPSSSAAKLSPTFAQLPMIFEPNRGQTDARVKFLARGNGYGLFLTESEAVLLLQAVTGKSSREVHASAVRMRLADANPSAQIEGRELLPGKSNYLIGNDPAKWRRGIPQYARVRYQQIYPGIDLVYYGNQGQLEYDFQVQPGADPRSVQLSFEGTQGLALNDAGDLLIKTSTGDLRLEAPRVYQPADHSGNSDARTKDARTKVDGRFRLLAGNTVGFEIGDYDRTRTLVIDPVLSYSTYLGGTKSESGPKIAVDSAFSFYVTGATTSTDFPVTTGSLQGTLKGAQNVFIAKFSIPSGQSTTPFTLTYATYLGGSGTDSAVGIGVDAGFDAYVAGTTTSSDFPTSSSSALQTTPKAAGTHAFVSKLDSAGATLLYSTYLSGSGTDTASGMAVDNKGLVYVIGITTSADFPVAPNPGAFQTTRVGPISFFVSQLNPANSGTNSLPYSTYFGGGFPTTGTVTGGAIAVDNNPSGSNIYITGGTNFQNTGTNPATDFPIKNGFQPCLDQPKLLGNCQNATALDAFVAKITPTNATGAQLIYSTYLGGSADDVGTAIGTDSAGNAYVGGTTSSSDFFFLPNIFPYQPNYGGGASDGFVGKVSNPAAGGTTTLITLTYFSYLGGSGTDSIQSLVVDPIAGARVVGATDSTNFPVAPSPGALQPTIGGATDAFMARIDTIANVATNQPGVFATYFGGSGIDRGTGVAIDSNGSTYITGETQSTNLPMPAGVTPFQGTLKGTQNAFIAKLGPNLNLSVVGCANTSATTANPCSKTPPSVSAGNQVAFIYNITNNADATSGVAFVDNLSTAGVSANFVSATTTGGSCPTIPTNNQLICSIGTINGGQTATVTVNMTPTTGPGNIGNSGQVIVAGSSFTASSSATAAVNTFTAAVAPPSFTVTAGQPATYTVTVTPNTVFTASVSLSCSAGLPPGSTVGCAFSTNPITLPNASPSAVTLTLNTTARTTTTTELKRLLPVYAALVPVGGLAFLGVGLTGASRKRRVLAALLFMGLASLIVLQPACSGSSSTKNTVGTPAGTYTVQVTATSGSFSQTEPITLVVQ